MTRYSFIIVEKVWLEVCEYCDGLWHKTMTNLSGCLKTGPFAQFILVFYGFVSTIKTYYLHLEGVLLSTLSTVPITKKTNFLNIK